MIHVAAAGFLSAQPFPSLAPLQSEDSTKLLNVPALT